MYKSQLKEDRRPVSKSVTEELTAKLHEKQMNAIIMDSRPFGDFSRPGMREFLAAAVPGFRPFHRTTVRRRLRVRYHEHRQKLRQALSRVSDIALTTDIWKDARNRYYICVTGHFFDDKYKFVSLTLSFQSIRGRHLADRLSQHLKREIMLLNIEEKVRSITSDNASNIVSAIKQLDYGTHHSCMAHNLHLIVQSVLFPKRKK